MPDLTPWIIGVGVIVALLAIAGRFDYVIVHDYQRGLRYSSGKFTGLVGPGGHWIFKPRSSIEIVDTRLTDLPLPGQELVTSDGISVKISLTAQFRIADAVVATHEVDSYHTAMYTALQVALREAVAAMTIDDVLAKRADIGPDVLRRSVERLKAFGVELVTVDVRDLMLPAATKRLVSQVIEARQRGIAALEKARGETAALRALANGARMMDTNPSLLNLRLLQQLESTSGNTILFGVPPNVVPVPTRAAGATSSSDVPARESELEA